jgi:thiosulfate/3-mercaptopyruvate sulfurtransferase
VTHGPLIDADELARLISSASRPPTILDVRWQLLGGAERDAYREGHIPGAVFVDLDRQLADPPGPRGRHPLPSAGRFTAEMRAAGVHAARPVVVYDGAGALAAARAWWLLRYFGHPRVSVLDGGLAAWIAAGHPLETEVRAPSPGDFVAQPGGMPTVDAEEVTGLSADGVLLDARAFERFTGAAEPVDPVAGHIPGARNRPAVPTWTPPAASGRPPSCARRSHGSACARARPWPSIAGRGSPPRTRCWRSSWPAAGRR